MRNITNEDVEFLLGADNDMKIGSFGDAISSKFVNYAIDNGFPSTVSTVLSVATKLDVGNVGNARCVICQKETTEELCEPCQRLIQQISEDKRDFVVNCLRLEV
jgi:uncharacterized protein (UPF0333 family)